MHPEIHWAKPGVLTWTRYSEEVRAELTSTALLSSGELLVFDPIPFEEEAMAQLRVLGTPKAVLLSNGNHERASVEFAKGFGIPVYGPVLAKDEIRADVWFIPGDPALPAGLEAIALPGFATGETAFYSPSLQLLILGDAVVNLPSRGPEILPEKYCADQEVGARALHALADLDFDLVCLAHGEPIIRSTFLSLISA